MYFDACFLCATLYADALRQAALKQFKKNNYDDRKTLVLGASTDPDRYSHLAAMRLSHSGHAIINVGLSTGNIAGVEIEMPETVHPDIHTVTLLENVDEKVMLHNLLKKENDRVVAFTPFPF